MEASPSSKFTISQNLIFYSYKKYPSVNANWLLHKGKVVYIPNEMVYESNGK